MTSTNLVDVDLDHDVYALAQRADVRSPDGYQSPGARLLNSCQDSANEFDAEALLDAVRAFVASGEDADDFGVNDLPSDVQDSVSESADSAVQIYTYQVWQEFTDLCLWEEDLTDLGEVDGENLTRDVAMRAEYMVASRLIPALLAERAARLYEENPQPEGDPGDDEPMDMSGGSGGSEDR